MNQVFVFDDFAFYHEEIGDKDGEGVEPARELHRRRRRQVRDPHRAPRAVPDPDRRRLRRLIAAAGWHAWRPAHLHVKVSAPGHELLTAQLYFPGDEHNDDDIASAVKPELVLTPRPSGDGEAIEYGFVLDPQRP